MLSNGIEKVDFTGGEFALTEQRPRMQTRVEVVPLREGDAVIFAAHFRPQKGTKGYYRVNMRHGVSRLRSGHRQTMGVIFTMWRKVNKKVCSNELVFGTSELSLGLFLSVAHVLTKLSVIGSRAEIGGAMAGSETGKSYVSTV